MAKHVQFHAQAVGPLVTPSRFLDDPDGIHSIDPLNIAMYPCLRHGRCLQKGRHPPE